MAKSTTFKRVVVREDAKTNMRASKIHPLKLADGTKIAVLAHLYFPYHDRSMFETTLKALEVEKPAVTILAGGIVAEDAFKSLWETEDNFLHDAPEVPEVKEAREAGLFEDRIMTLANRCREEVFERIAKVTGGLVIWIPSWTHLSMGNEVRLTEWVQFTKRYLDGWMLNHPDSSDIVSDPGEKLPKELDKLFGLEGNPNIKVLRYGAGVKVNNELLFMIGDFRRRNAGDASQVEWQQRGISVVRSFDGKVASTWWTTPNHSQPGLRLNYWQAHEVGYMWDPIYMAHYRDYDRRAAGFWFGQIVHGKVIGNSVPFLRGDDGRRSFMLNMDDYTEATPGCTSVGEELSLPHPDAVLGTPEAKSSVKPARKKAAPKTKATAVKRKPSTKKKTGN